MTHFGSCTGEYLLLITTSWICNGILQYLKVFLRHADSISVSDYQSIYNYDQLMITQKSFSNS